MKISIIGLAVLCFATAPAWAASYDVYADFGGANPNGPWRYGYVAAATGIGNLDTTLTSMASYDAACVSGLAQCWTAGSASAVAPDTTFNSGTVNFSAGYVTMHPDSNLNIAVIGFIAPVTANYTFAGEFIDQDVVGGSGVQLAAVLGNGTALLGPSVLSAVFSPVAINFTQSLNEGEAVYFAVGANGEWSFDSTGLKLSVTDDLAAVPEPSTWALTAIGSVAAAAVRLGRRRSN